MAEGDALKEQERLGVGAQAQGFGVENFVKAWFSTSHPPTP